MNEAVLRYSAAGAKKVQRSFIYTLISAFMAGVFIALAGTAAVIGSATFSGSAGRLVSSLIFPAGLAMVVVNGTELFTGNCLMVISCADKKITPIQLLKNWCTVYLGNMLGGLFVSAVSVFGHVYSAFDSQAGAAAVNTAAAKCAISFSDGILKGILCNVLVCIAVIMTFTAEKTADKIIVLFLPITVFVLCGFEHSVANMGYIPAGIFLGYIGEGAGAALPDWYGFFITNLVPVTIGNIIGGGLTGLLMYFLAKQKSGV